MGLVSEYRKNRALYNRTLALAVPMILQNLITNFVSMLDNIMVGRIGTPEMSGVSIANQLIFVFNITIFGGLSGAGIFGTQFFGKGDHEGQKYTVRYRILLVTIVTAIAMLLFTLLGEPMISLYISKDDAPELAASTLKFGMEYLKIMVWCLIPFGFGQAYASVVRECGETKIPMYASLAAIGVNLFLDYSLIFGKFGFPMLGVRGAAIATVIAKTIEALVVIIWAHTHKEKNKYIVGLYKSLKIPRDLFGRITVKGFPLLINEFLWSLGVSVIAQCYSVLGLNVVAARNIAMTVTNLTNVVYIQLGAAIGIIIGTILGSGELKEAEVSAKKLIWFSVIASSAAALLLVPLSFVFPMLYNTTAEIRGLATYIILIQAFVAPLWAYTNACYFTLRSGGKTGITFLFDFIFSWVIQIPLAFVLTRYSNLQDTLIIAIVIYSEIIKCVTGYFMVKSGVWINNIVGTPDDMKLEE